MGRGGGGKGVAGRVAAENERGVREQRRRKDVFVTSLTIQKAASASGASAFRKKKVGLNDMVVMSRQLATLVRAGLPLVESLGALINQTQNPTLRQALTVIRTDGLAGATFNGSLWKHPETVSQVFQAPRID